MRQSSNTWTNKQTNKQHNKTIHLQSKLNGKQNIIDIIKLKNVYEHALSVLIVLMTAG